MLRPALCCAVLALSCRSLHEAGCEKADILEKSMESGSVLVGDVADEIEADLVLISSEAVHTKQVDANLLAEFVPCPVLLLPWAGDCVQLIGVWHVGVLCWEGYLLLLAVQEALHDVLQQDHSAMMQQVYIVMFTEHMV